MRQEDMFQTATSSQQDTHANHSVSLGSEKAQKMTATSGRTSAKLLHPKDPLGAFSRMFMGTSHWDSTKCLLTWKPKATPQGRLLFQLAVSMPTTKETESGLWPTPRASEYKDSGPVGSKSHKHMKDRHYLCAEVKDQQKPTGKLNPEWVEWLMGYPEGWTELKD